MWNKIVDALREPASKRLGIAIVISAALHAILFGKMYMAVSVANKPMYLIEARIQMPPPLPKSAPESATDKLAEIPAVPQQDALPEPLPEPVPEAKPETEPETEQVATVESVPIIEPKAPPAPAVDNVDTIPIQVPPQPEDMGWVPKDDAYQYLETEFDVSTAIDGKAEGKAKIIYDVSENQYQISWLTEGTGIAALLFPDLLQTSEGELIKSGLRPHHYLYQFGKNADKTRSASFDWSAKKVILQTAKGTKTEDLPEGTQDLLSFMYQFMYVPPLQSMQLPIVNGKSLGIYDYSIEGTEQINSALGELKAIHILHNGNNDNEKTELWLAISYQYAPVKIRKTESDGSVVEMLAQRISPNRHAIDR